MSSARRLLTVRRNLSILGLKFLHKLTSLQKEPIFKIYGKTFKIHPNVFHPRWSITSLMLVKNLDVKLGDVVLDMGCGCGIQAIFAAERAFRVVAVDVNPFAVCLAWENVRLNGLEGKVEVRLGNLFQPIKQNEKFNLIIFNPPFFPGKPKNVVENAWIDEDGEIMQKFFSKVGMYLFPGGRVQITYSSIASLSIDELEKLFEENKFEVKVKIKKKLLTETLYLYTLKTLNFKNFNINTNLPHTGSVG